MQVTNKKFKFGLTPTELMYIRENIVAKTVDNLVNYNNFLTKHGGLSGEGKGE